MYSDKKVKCTVFLIRFSKEIQVKFLKKFKTQYLRNWMHHWLNSLNSRKKKEMFYVVAFSAANDSKSLMRPCTVSIKQKEKWNKNSFKNANYTGQKRKTNPSNSLQKSLYIFLEHFLSVIKGLLATCIMSREIQKVIL